MFNGLAAMSLVLLAAIASVWAVSYLHPLGYSRNWYALWYLDVTSKAGEFRAEHNTNLPRDYSQGNWAQIAPQGIYNYGPPVFRLERMTVMAWLVKPGEPTAIVPTPASRMTLSGWWWRVRCSYWFVSLLLATLPMLWLVNHQRQRGDRRLAVGQCPQCGYDLRATPNRCPECGTVPPNAA